MMTNQDLSRLEAELLTEDLTALKRRRTNNRRDATRNERYCKDSAAQALDDLDFGSIEHHLQKINADISIAGLLQDAILAHVKEEDEEKEEEDYHSHHRKMLATRKGLNQQLTTARVHEQLNLSRTSIDSLSVQPTITNYGVKVTLQKLETQLADLKAQVYSLKDRPELMDNLQSASKDLTTLWKRYHDDNPVDKVSSEDVKPKGMSKFDRLPRIELPSFNGENSGWRPYWEKFTNVLEKDPTLSDIDRLSFLLMTMKCKEGKEIIDSHTRQGPDYDAAVRALKERYDQPRIISRSTHQCFVKHAWKLTDEGIGQIITLIQRTVATMKECSVDSLETVYTVMAELLMPDEFFRYWTERTAEANTTPTIDKLVELLQQYRLRLQGRTVVSPATQAKPKQGKSTTLYVQKQDDCTLCHDGNHPLYLCAAFKTKSVEDRFTTTSRLKACTNCLSLKHSCRDCPSRSTCRICGNRHHSLLHRKRLSPQATEFVPERQTASTSTNAHATPSCNSSRREAKVILGICQVTVESRGRRQRARALLDSGSHMSFMTNRLAQSLKVRKIHEPTQLTGISQTEVPDCPFKAELSLLPDGHSCIPMSAVIIPQITGDLPGFHLRGVRNLPFLQDLTLADPNFDQPGRIDLLFGSDVLDQLMLPGRKSSLDGKLHAWETVFGWSVRGKYVEPPSLETRLCLHSRAADSSTDDLLEAFWKTEEAPSDLKHYTDEEQQALEHFEKTHSRNEEGRYIVRLPVKSVPLILGASRGQACKRFYQNQQSLQRKGKFEDYSKALQEYADLGHAEPVPALDLNKPDSSVFYLPSHGVVKLSSTTTKLRVVFDASAKTTTGVSLNNTLLPGPSLYPLLTDVVLAFRTHVIGMSADISKMFREVELHKDDRDLHRFLQATPRGEGVMDMRMTRVTFGVTSSPFLATQVLRQVAKDHEQQYPRAAKIMSKFYVDDCLTGAATTEEAIEIQEELIALLRCACMWLRKWRSNDTNVLENVPADMREDDNHQLIAPPAECHKALGIHWDTRNDTLHVSTPTLTANDNPTKRKIASDVAKTFDLLGWFAPCSIVVKIMLQDLWKLKIAWDEPVPQDIAQAWKDWRDELPLITSHPIPRYHLVRGKEVRSLQLHGFSDASDSAYAGVVYLRAVYSDTTVSTSLLLAKTKVTPISGSTIPRKELNGAHLLSKILITAANVLSISLADMFAWCDSTIVLCWLSTPPAKLKTYVCNRVMDTISRVPATHWRYVPTDCNPADVASRGATPRHLISFGLWWNGPDWLQRPPSAWPARTDWRSQKNLAETKPMVLLTAPPLEDFTEAFSSYIRLKRVVTWCLRFIFNCRSVGGGRVSSPRLSLNELQITETRLLKLSQSRSFKADHDSLLTKDKVSSRSSISHLRPYLDKEGLIRVGGRLEKSDLTVGQKHPVVLHRKDHLAKLICEQLHVDNLHVGPTALLAILSLQFCVIGAKHLTKSVSRSCVRCRKVYARTSTQLMGQLPASRVTASSPFHHTGADFAGPIMVKRGHTRARTLEKTYICVFVCMATKAVHLEVVRDLSADGFIAALRCFVARRGCPETLATDNGTNFIGAQKELKELYNLLSAPKTQTAVDRYCTAQHIKWTHTPARSPHFGGLWEAAVKSMKLLLTKVIGPHNLFIDELYSITVEIEAVLNSRPLIPLDSTPDDGIEVLTPGHFLVGKALKAVPAPNLSTHKHSSLSRWNLRLRLMADFWERWSTDYMSRLNNFKKCHQPQRSVAVGDIVLVKDSDLFIRSWPLARVIQTHPGDDGLVRVVTVKTQKGTYRRAIHKLVPILEEASFPPGGCSGSDPPLEELSI